MARLAGACLSALIVLVASLAAAEEISLNGQKFTLPDGFEIEVVARPPLVNRPVTAAFDEQGRLYVADSSGCNDSVQKQLVTKPHRILRLEDTDGDGRFDRSTVFADHMMFPEGTMWLDGSLYVSAPPTIWKLTDTNGDGVADRREEWLTKTAQHCANDLHGPYPGPDGWIYWCKGAFERQTYERPGKPPFVTRAAHIFRAPPDRRVIEPVMTGGMDNPVDVVFTPGGERIFSTTFLTHPRDGQRDGLIHAIYGGVYGKPHDVIDGHKRTGELMPPLVHLGPAACCGLARYESRVFGPEYRGNLFTCCFNMRKVTRSALKPKGATFAAKTDDFLVSSSIDFHPTDVVEDADGSLLIVDTGGWYKLCCPTSQLWKPDILGAIYRVRRKGASVPDDPRGLQIAWRDVPPASLVKRLGDRRPAVRTRAIQVLAKGGLPAVAPLEEGLKSQSGSVRRNAVWTLCRIDEKQARTAIRSALGDRNDTVRQAALHAVSLWRDRAALRRLIEVLRTGSPQNRRAAAEALGRIGDPSAIAALLEASGTLESGPTHDRVLEHSLTYALIEIDDPAATRVGLNSDRSWTRRAALIAVDQMEGGGLAAGPIAELLSSNDAVLKRTASWIIAHHADWGGALAGSLRERLRASSLSEADRAELEAQLTQFASNKSVEDLLTAVLADRAISMSTKQTVLAAMRGSGLKAMPREWVAVLSQVLASGEPKLVGGAAAAFRALPVPKDQAHVVGQTLQAVASDGRVPAVIRLDALAAIPNGMSNVPESLFEFLQSHLNSDLPVTTRAAAAEVLSRARLSHPQLLHLADSLKTAGPLEADRLLTAFEGCDDETVGRRLLAALAESPALTSLRVDSIQRRIVKQPSSVQAKAEELYRRINADLATQRQRIQDLLPLVDHGDVRRGQAVFAQTKIACMSCHQFGYAGGHIGPDLTHVGGIRSDRDLLEAIMFPSASFVRSFEPMQIVTKNGKVVNGLVRKDAPDEIVLVASATETVRVPRDEIEELRPSKVSIMPAGLDKQLTPKELADLVAFLKHAK